MLQPERGRVNRKNQLHCPFIPMIQFSKDIVDDLQKWMRGQDIEPMMGVIHC